MSWYDLTEKKESKKEYIQKVKYDKIICEKANRLKTITKSELKENIQYRIITETAFNAITVIKYIMELYELKEVYIAVYRMNQMSVNKIIEIIEKNNIEIKIILSSFFRENKRYEKWCEDLIRYSENKTNVNIKFEHNHAKVFLCKTKCNKYIVFEGSGNLSDNARIEQYILENNKIVYDFHKNWINEIINK